MATIHVSTTREDLRAKLALLPAMIVGRVADPQCLQRGFCLRLAVAFLEKIKIAFIVKARGGTDEAGIKWKPLSKAYVAYQRRFGSGEKAALKKAAGLGRGHRWAPGGADGLLTKDQEKAWWVIYRKTLAWAAKSMAIGEAKAVASGAAWNWIKKNLGAKTKLEVYGNREVEIGRDTGILFNSLSPGEVVGSGVSVYLSDQPRSQEIHIEPGRMYVGTNVPYAAGFHKLRPIWPDGDQMPEDWLDYFGRQASQAIREAVKQIVRAA